MAPVYVMERSARFQQLLNNELTVHIYGKYSTFTKCLYKTIHIAFGTAQKQ